MTEKILLKLEKCIRYKDFESAVFLSQYLEIQNSQFNLLTGILMYENNEYARCIFKFKNSNEGLIQKWPKKYKLYGWLVAMKSGGKLSAHMHESGWISGSIYINVPKTNIKNSGSIVFCVEEEQYLTNGKKSTEKIIDVVTGSLCLFPSSLLHYTIPFESEEERIVLAFDLQPDK